MKWMKERDLLIAQTLAFVQSVTGKTPETARLLEAAKPPEVARAAEATKTSVAIKTSEATKTSERNETVAVPASSPRMVETVEPIHRTGLTLAEIALVLPQSPPAAAPAPIAVPPPAEARPQPAKAPIVEVRAEAARQISSSVPFARLDLRGDFQAEIRARVASFRAHQERFSREREAYCAATMAKVQAALKDANLLPSQQEK